MRFPVHIITIIRTETCSRAITAAAPDEGHLGKNKRWEDSKTGQPKEGVAVPHTDIGYRKNRGDRIFLAGNKNPERFQ